MSKQFFYGAGKVLVATTILMSSQVYAEVEIKNKNNNIFSDFIYDSHMDFSLRNVFKHLSTEDYAHRSIQNAWGQGFTFDFRSGYLADMLGVDASYYNVVKLAASDEFYGRSVLYNNHGKARGFNKFGQIYGKFRLGDDDTYFRVYSGWKEMRKWGALNISNRAIPSTYLGWSAEAGTGPLRVRGAYVTRYSDRDSPKKIHFLSADKKREISSISTAEVSYQNQDYSALYFFGESHNYLQRHGVELGWQPMTLSNHRFKVSTQFYMNHALEDWTSMAASAKTFDENAYHYAINTEWREGGWKHKVGASYTQASLASGLGRFEWHHAKHSRGTFNSMADSWGNDYVGNKEKMLAWTFGYAITPEFELGAVTNYGWGMKYKGNKITRGETIAYSRWTPSAIKNLSIQLSGGPSWNFQSQGNRPKLSDDGKTLRAQNNSIELQVDYKTNLF